MKRLMVAGALTGACLCARGERLSLAGEWRFALGETNALSDTICLPTTSVLANGKPIWNDVDFREAQGRDFRKALLCTAEVEVSDGEILLEWRPERKSHPSIPLANGIEIEPLGAR